MVQKRKGANRKGHMSFFVPDFLNFNLVPIDSELNYAPGNQTFFTKNFSVVPRKVAKPENVG